MYRDQIIEQLRRKIKRQQTNLDISHEQLHEMEDIRDKARKEETKKTSGAHATTKSWPAPPDQ